MLDHAARTENMKNAHRFLVCNTYEKSRKSRYVWDDNNKMDLK